MKSRIASAAIALAFAVPVAAVSAQSTPPKPPVAAQEKHDMHAMHHAAGAWSQLNAFHEIMAGAWHPAKDSANLKPAREKATALVEAAKTLAASKTPVSCDTRPVRDAVTAVATDTRAFAALVAKQAPDSTLKAALKELHDRFEIANKGCAGAAKH